MTAWRWIVCNLLRLHGPVRMNLDDREARCEWCGKRVTL